jgi:hypothetical protein
MCPRVSSASASLSILRCQVQSQRTANRFAADHSSLQGPLTAVAAWEIHDFDELPRLELEAYPALRK